MKRIFLAAVLLLFITTGCQYLDGQRVNGDGHITSQDRSVGSFNSVHASGSMNVHISQGASNSVRIEADQNLMQYIDVYVKGNTLVVRNKEGYNVQPSRDIVVYATAPVFRGIEVSGAGDIVGDNTISGNEPLEMHVSGSGNINMQVNLPKVSTEVSGSGDVMLKGQAQEFNAEISGSGKVKCFDLVTENTTLDLSGASDAEVTANKKLDIEVSGSGSVHYKGTASVNQKISGSGEIRKID
jgi:hypothetical protein